jgi:hypothetical protein
MASEKVTRKINAHLKSLMLNQGLKLEYVARSSNVGVETVRRVKEGKITKLWDKTAHSLAGFIEAETAGKVSVACLLSDNPEGDFQKANLEGISLEGEDLQGYDFTRANLQGANLARARLGGAVFDLANLQGAILEGVEGQASFVGANLKGAFVKDVKLEKWAMGGVDAEGATFEGCIFNRTVMIGSDLSKARFENIYWDTNGTRTRGILLPENLDPDQVAWGNDCHDIVAALLRRVFPENDLELQQIRWFILSREFPCWDGFVAFLLKHYPRRLDDVFSAFRMYPATRLVERLELSFEFHDLSLLPPQKALGGYMALKESKYYELFKKGIDIRIRKLREACGEAQSVSLSA